MILPLKAAGFHKSEEEIKTIHFIKGPGIEKNLKILVILSRSL